MEHQYEVEVELSTMWTTHNAPWRMYMHYSFPVCDKASVSLKWYTRNRWSYWRTILGNGHLSETDNMKHRSTRISAPFWRWYLHDIISGLRETSRWWNILEKVRDTGNITRDLTGHQGNMSPECSPQNHTILTTHCPSRKYITMTSYPFRKNFSWLKMK